MLALQYWMWPHCACVREHEINFDCSLVEYREVGRAAEKHVRHASATRRARHKIPRCRRLHGPYPTSGMSTRSDRPLNWALVIVRHMSTLKHMYSEARSKIKEGRVGASVLELHTAHQEAMRGVDGDTFNQDVFFRFAMKVAVDLSHAIELIGSVLLAAKTALTPQSTWRSIRRLHTSSRSVSSATEEGDDATSAAHTHRAALTRTSTKTQSALSNVVFAKVAIAHHQHERDEPKHEQDDPTKKVNSRRHMIRRGLRRSSCRDMRAAAQLSSPKREEAAEDSIRRAGSGIEHEQQTRAKNLKDEGTEIAKELIAALLRNSDMAQNAVKMGRDHAEAAQREADEAFWQHHLGHMPLACGHLPEALRVRSWLRSLRLACEDVVERIEQLNTAIAQNQTTDNQNTKHKRLLRARSNLQLEVLGALPLTEGPLADCLVSSLCDGGRDAALGAALPLVKQLDIDGDAYTVQVRAAPSAALALSELTR